MVNGGRHLLESYVAPPCMYKDVDAKETTKIQVAYSSKSKIIVNTSMKTAG